MKTGTHPNRALSALKVRKISKPGRYADGNGLYLVVDPSGARRWMLRIVVQGRRRDIGFGSARVVELADAREAAQHYRGIARRGGDPISELRKARRFVPTFESAAKMVHAEHAKAWDNAKHTNQWLNTLTAYAFPEIGTRRIDDIETSDLLKILSPIWLTKPETAKRVKQRLRVIFDWAKVSGHRSGDNPVDGIQRALPKRPDRVVHHAAMPYGNVANFVTNMRNGAFSETIKLAFEFLILTAARTNEVLGCRWEEIDQHNKVWTVPPSRMKAGREHRVPLAPRCLEILERARKIAESAKFVFPGRNPEEHLSSMALLMALRRMGESVTVHGFRSAFRDWSAERTNFSREVCEMALAHTIRDKTEAAYRRGDLFEKRSKLMKSWAVFANSLATTLIAFPARAG